MSGFSQDSLEHLAAVFGDNFCNDGEIGAAVAVYLDGREIANLAGGWTSKHHDQPWTESTIAPVYSATKGPAVVCLLDAMAGHGLDPDTLVSHVWPEFSSSITIGQLLSHQGGLAALEEKIPVEDFDGVVAALARQQPAWSPPEHGYHPRTFGYLLDNLVRRITSAPSLGWYWRSAIADPHQIDIWIGLPAVEHHRVATLYPGRSETSAEEAAFYAAFNNPATETRRAFQSPMGMHSVAEMNQAKAWTTGLAGFGGVASARGLAHFYGLLASGQLLPGRVSAWLTTRLVDGLDRILYLPTAFSAGMMLDPLDPRGTKFRHIFGPNSTAFGHPGAGGSHGFADPQSGLGFGYVMNQMTLGVLPPPKVRRLVNALYGREGISGGQPA